MAEIQLHVGQMYRIVYKQDRSQWTLTGMFLGKGMADEYMFSLRPKAGSVNLRAKSILHGAALSQKAAVVLPKRMAKVAKEVSP